MTDDRNESKHKRHSDGFGRDNSSYISTQAIYHPLCFPKLPNPISDSFLPHCHALTPTWDMHKVHAVPLTLTLPTLIQHLECSISRGSGYRDPREKEAKRGGSDSRCLGRF